MRVILFAVVLLISVSCNNKTETKESVTPLSERVQILDSLDKHFTAISNKDDLPGFVVSMFSKDSIYLSKGYGKASIEKNKAYNKQTVQMIASVSKTVLAVALMTAVEDGSLGLDDSINKYLPFEITHPKFRDTPITIRHLATHTASISDDPNGGKGNIFEDVLKKENWREVWHPIIEKYNQNVNESMPDFLQSIFSDTGKRYSKDTFLDYTPGTFYEYSNFGCGLLGYIIENATGTNYKTFTELRIFNPLNMRNTGWNRESVDQVNHITYYNDNYNVVPNYHIITYPDGGLFSSAEDLTYFLQEMMKGYEGEGRLLSKESYDEMFKSQYSGLESKVGILWDLDQDCCIGHGGNDFGVASMMYFYKDQGIGRVVLTNIDIQQAHQEETFYGIHDTLYRFN